MQKMINRVGVLLFIDGFFKTFLYNSRRIVSQSSLPHNLNILIDICLEPSNFSFTLFFTNRDVSSAFLMVMLILLGQKSIYHFSYNAFSTA